MQLLADLVRSLPKINTVERALSAIKTGVELKNHYQIWCHERFHLDGSRCSLPEDFFSWPSVPRPHTLSALKDLFRQHASLRDQYVFQGKLVCCPLAHVKTDKWKMDFFNLVVTVGRNELLNRSFDTIAADVNWYVALVGAGTGTIAITSGQNTVTGTTTTFDAALASAPIADIIIVGAGAAAADLITTVASRTSNTAITTTANAGTTVTAAAFATEAVPTDTMSAHINSWSETTPYSNANRPTWTKNAAASAGAMSNSSSKASFTVNATGRAFGAFLVNNNTKGGTTGVLYGLGLDTTNGSRSVVSGDTLNCQIDLSVTAS